MPWEGHKKNREGHFSDYNFLACWLSLFGALLMFRILYTYTHPPTAVYFTLSTKMGKKFQSEIETNILNAFKN